MRACPKCHHLNQDNAEYCTSCGYRLTGGPLAIECPHCGKLCALGTKFCPVCHHRLPEVQRKVFQAPAKKPLINSRILKIIAGISIIFLAAFMAYNLKVGTVRQSNAPYTVVCLKYSDHHRNFRYAQYYIVKQETSAKRQYRFTMAYAGQGKQGLRRVSNNDIKVIREKFRRYPHYHLTVKKRTTYLSGPQKAQIALSTRKLIHHNKGQSRFPSFNNERFHCYVAGNFQIGYIRFTTPVANAIDD